MKIISPSVIVMLVYYLVVTCVLIYIGNLVLDHYICPYDDVLFRMTLFWGVITGGGFGLLMKSYLVIIYMTDTAIFQRRDSWPPGLIMIPLDKLTFAKETYKRIYLKSIDDDNKANFIVVPKLVISKKELNEIMSNVVT